jgi:hypothetical protein
MTAQRAACAVVTKNGRVPIREQRRHRESLWLCDRPGRAATLLNADGITAVTGANPTDMALSHDSKFLYARIAGLSAIAIFRIQSDGSLTPLAALTGTLAGLVGLAGF